MSRVRLNRARVTVLAALAAVAVAAVLAGLAAMSSGAAAPVPVVFDYWHGPHETPLYGAIRPAVLGDRYGEPLTALRWRSWRPGSAAGQGELVHMSCQPCRASVRLSAPVSSHGRLYFGREQITYVLGRSASSVTLHWSWAARSYT
jgi:hypothetical protein